MTQTHTLAVPGARIVYDVRETADPGTDATPLLMIGAPMDASGFATLAGFFPDRTVVTCDPRNTGRSSRDEPTAAVSPEQHADDLHRLVEALDRGPVDVLASSGGAVNALVWVARDHGDVRILVAHEPPAGGMLPDAEPLRAVCADIIATYDARGQGPAMARFIALITHRGPIDEGYLRGPEADPAAFGLAPVDDGSRDDPMMSNLRGGIGTGEVDAAALSAAPTRVVVAVGEESATSIDDGEMAGRSAYAVAAALGTEVAVFPSHHGGFLGGEFGQTGQPEAFAARLREVLARSRT